MTNFRQCFHIWLWLNIAIFSSASCEDLSNVTSTYSAGYLWDTSGDSGEKIQEFLREFGHGMNFSATKDVLAVSTLTAGNGTYVNYDGYQLWKVVVLKEENRYLIRALTEALGCEIWRINRNEADLFIDGAVVPLAEKLMQRAGQNYTVIFEDAQKLIDAEKKTFNKTDIMDWDGYHNYTVMEKFLHQTAEKYPNLTTLFTAGYSYEKRPLYVMRIGNGNPDSKVMWLDGGTHGREWISPASMFYIINELTEKWDNFPDYVKNKEWYIMPMINPDGYEYSRIYDRMWAKTRRNHGDCYGVDLDKNYDFVWGDKETNGNPCESFYHGDGPLSEPESQTLSRFARGIQPTPTAFLTYHCYGEVIFSGWGWKIGVPDDYSDLRHAILETIKALKVENGRNYSTMLGYEVFGVLAGGLDDWAKGLLGAKYAHTVEIGGTDHFGFLVPGRDIKNVARDALLIATSMAKVIG